jgi:FAD synthetase
MNEMPLRVPKDADDNAPVINGHDASILPLCAKLAARVNAFLETEAETPLLKAVQEQTRVALGVISTALDRYRYCLLLLTLTIGPQSRADNLLTGVQFR